MKTPSFAKRNYFPNTHPRVFTMDTGYLVPILAKEVLPGDTWKCKTDFIVRAVGSMLSPLMHEVNCYTRFFFEPNRLVWNKWEDFITGGRFGDDSSVPPYYRYTDKAIEPSSFEDYIGLPLRSSTSQPLKWSAFPAAAYRHIWTEWFRDEWIQDELDYELEDGENDATNNKLLRVNWEKDYFTSARPDAQKGPGIKIPLIGNAPLQFPTGISSTVTTDGLGLFNTGNTSGQTVYGALATNQAGVHKQIFSQVGVPNDAYADLSEVSAATINDLRMATQAQMFEEINARGGSRYVEYLLNHFGVRSPDMRLQRPEYLGGGKSPIIFSEVLQTSETSNTSPQGHMAGHGFSAQRTHEFTKSFTEHGWIIGLLYIIPRTGYQQGLHRQFSRETRYDYYHPVFAHLGEQAIKNKEIYADHPDQEGTFGYIGRWDEYRRTEGTVHGQVRTSLDYWSWQRIFNEPPALNSDFLQCNPGHRPFPSTLTDPWIVELVNRVDLIRPLPRTGEPGLMDHK